MDVCRIPSQVSCERWSLRQSGQWALLHWPINNEPISLSCLQKRSTCDGLIFNVLFSTPLKHKYKYWLLTISLTWRGTHWSQHWEIQWDSCSNKHILRLTHYHVDRYIWLEFLALFKKKCETGRLAAWPWWRQQKHIVDKSRSRCQLLARWSACGTPDDNL